MVIGNFFSGFTGYGVNTIDYLEKGEIINGEDYTELLQQLSDVIKTKPSNLAKKNRAFLSWQSHFFNWSYKQVNAYFEGLGNLYCTESIIKKLQYRWSKCIELEEDYVKK